MSILKLKTALAVTVIGVFSLSAPAFAQVTTDDVDAQRLLEQIRDYNEEIRDINDEIKITSDEIKTLQENAKEFRDKTTKPHYEREIKKLNAMIDTFGYWQSKDTEDPVKEPELFKKAFDTITMSDDARKSILAAGEGKSNEFGIMFDGFDGDGLGGTNLGASTVAKFRKALGLQAPKEIYPTKNAGSHRENLTRMYSSLYLANTVANEAHNGRVQRLEIYDELIEQAKTTDDLQAELRLQNAILLENGRNLALLIDLQTAQLNAQTVDIASTARSKNIPESMFGNSTALGKAAFDTLVNSLNQGYSDIN